KREFYYTKRGGRNLELAFRESLKKMRGTKSKEKFSQELEMSRSNYSRIESGKSDPTIKTLEQIAKLTNSTLVVDLIPNEPTEPEPETESEQVTLDLEMEEEKSNDFV
ncbi:TPA: helix-turn-helix domain-containing protein, partial [Enterococcus faecium]